MSLARIESELLRMVAIYPTLDTGTITRSSSTDGLLKLAMMSNPRCSIAPRVYAHAADGAFTMYCGLPVDPRGDCVASNAASIDQYWDKIKNRLEGTYVIVRVSENPTTLEIQTDLMGSEPIYYSRYGGGWIISNSVLLIERLSVYRTFDSLGVSMFLCLGPVLDDRTLRDGIHVMRGRERWTWTADRAEPVISNYYSLSKLANQPQMNLRNLDFDKLGSELGASLKNLDAQFDELVCPLTGGKDSRLVATLLYQAGITARYSTFGDSAGDDVQIAAKIARQFGLVHEVIKIDDSDIENNWDANCLPAIRSTDGMRSLFLLAGVLKPSATPGTSKDVYLWGACGEVARPFYGRLPFLKKEFSNQEIISAISKSSPANSYQLIRPSAQESAKAWQARWISDAIEQGIPTTKVPDVYGTFVIDARRLGNNGRALSSFRDTFTPFATRAFFEAAFLLSPLQRYTEPLHYGLIRRLLPAMHNVELANDSWFLQNALLRYVGNGAMLRMTRYTKGILRRTGLNNHSINKYSYDDSTFHRVRWFESERSKIREIALDSYASPVWDFVDKEKFERIMGDGESALVRSRSLKLLFHIATLIYYQCDTQRHVSPERQDKLPQPV